MRSYPKTRASRFIGVSKHLETIKALGLQPRAFIFFSVFGYPDETLALVSKIVQEKKNITELRWHYSSAVPEGKGLNSALNFSFNALIYKPSW